MMASTTHIALAALKAHPNWFLFPVKRFGKTPPLIPDNLDAASNDSQQIMTWAAKWPGCNWGLALRKSRVIVVDVDMTPGKIGRLTLDALELDHDDLPATFTVRSPSGGLHYYFNEANGVQHACRLGVHGFGRDVDSPNYVLLPGCEIRGANNTLLKYTVVNDASVAPAPAWFGLYLRPSNTDDADQDIPAAELDTPAAIDWAKDYLAHDAPPAIEGHNGEHTLLMVAAVLKDHGLSEWQSVELLGEFYNSRCSPQWSIGEGPTADRLDVKVHNAWLYLRQTRPGAHTAAADFGDDIDPLMDAPPPQPSPSAVKAQAKWIKGRARRQREATDRAMDAAEELERERAAARRAAKGNRL